MTKVLKIIEGGNKWTHCPTKMGYKHPKCRTAGVCYYTISWSHLFWLDR